MAQLNDLLVAGKTCLASDTKIGGYVTANGNLFVIQAAGGGERQNGLSFGVNSNDGRFYLYGNTTSGARGIYDSALGSVISVGNNQFFHHGTVIAKNGYSYGTEAQRNAIVSPSTGQVFFQLI